MEERLQPFLKAFPTCQVRKDLEIRLRGLAEMQGILKEAGNLMKNFNQGQQNQQQPMPVGFPGMIGMQGEPANAQELGAAGSGGEVAQAAGGGGLGDMLGKVFGGIGKGLNILMHPIASAENTMYTDAFAAEKTAAAKAKHDAAIAAGADPRFLQPPPTYTAEGMKIANMSDDLPPSAVWDYDPYGSAENRQALALAQMGQENKLAQMEKASELRTDEAGTAADLERQKQENLWDIARKNAGPTLTSWDNRVPEASVLEEIKDVYSGRDEGLIPDLQIRERLLGKPTAEERTAEEVQSIIGSNKAKFQNLGYSEEEALAKMYDFLRQTRSRAGDRGDVYRLFNEKIRKYLENLEPARRVQDDAILEAYKIMNQGG